MSIAADSPELAIRARRAAFNRALADADSVAIAALLAPDAVLVTGTDSAVVSGRKAQVLVWKRAFADRDRVLYTRLPDRIELSAVEPIAMEHGKWQGTSLAGEVLASGRYAAKWRKTAQDWMIEAEIYLTLA